MNRTAIIVGSGPAGLSAAEVLAGAGWTVTVVEALPSPGRKFLRAGVGGLNLTNALPFDEFLGAYGPSRPRLEPYLKVFGPGQLQAWVKDLGIGVFTGSSGRIFPEGMGAKALLDKWIGRLDQRGVTFVTGTRWVGWGPDNGLELEKNGVRTIHKADAVVLASGGPTWPDLGTGGTWTGLLADRGIAMNPWKPANCGFLVGWTDFFREKFSGHPLKETVLTFDDGQTAPFRKKGELMVTRWGLEGGLIYAAGSRLRAAVEEKGAATFRLDLVPGRDLARVEADLSRPQETRSLATHLKKALGIGGVKAGLLREILRPGTSDTPARVAGLLKDFPVTVTGTRPLAEAISAAGGVCWDELTGGLELKKVPGVWCAGEMVDWEAPTGGYLLTACFSLGRAAGRDIGSRRP